MDNIGTVFFRGRDVPVQVTDRGHVYVSGSPVEQYPRDLRDVAIAAANRFKDSKKAKTKRVQQLAA